MITSVQHGSVSGKCSAAIHVEFGNVSENGTCSDVRTMQGGMGEGKEIRSVRRSMSASAEVKCLRIDDVHHKHGVRTSPTDAQGHFGR